MNTTLLIVLVIVAAVVIFAIGIYNKLIRGRIRVKEAWSDIDVQLKRRLNLIPNLVETVKGYQTHEQETLSKVTEARANALNASTMAERSQAENALGTAAFNLLAVAENYPDLKASANFLELQRELRDTEDKIQAARRFYNGLVRDYNISLGVFPNNLFASPFGFTTEVYFELEDDTAREPVKVKF
jgi:LemA protein